MTKFDKLNRLYTDRWNTHESWVQFNDCREVLFDDKDITLHLGLSVPDLLVVSIPRRDYLGRTRHVYVILTPTEAQPESDPLTGKINKRLKEQFAFLYEADNDQV